MSKIDTAKLKALQEKAKAAKVGGQRMKKPVAAAKEAGGDRKIINTVHKLGGRPIQITELNFFHSATPEVTTFTRPKASVAVQSNTWTFSGKSQTRPIAEMLPGIMNHLGLENLAALRDAFGPPPGEEAMMGMGAEDVPNFDDVADEDDAPELVE